MAIMKQWKHFFIFYWGPSNDGLYEVLSEKGLELLKAKSVNLESQNFLLQSELYTVSHLKAHNSGHKTLLNNKKLIWNVPILLQTEKMAGLKIRSSV